MFDLCREPRSTVSLFSDRSSCHAAPFKLQHQTNTSRKCMIYLLLCLFLVSQFALRVCNGKEKHLNWTRHWHQSRLNHDFLSNNISWVLCTEVLLVEWIVCVSLTFHKNLHYSKIANPSSSESGKMKRNSESWSERDVSDNFRCQFFFF